MKIVEKLTRGREFQKKEFRIKELKFRRKYSWRKEFGIKDSESWKRKEKIEKGIRNLGSGIPIKKKRKILISEKR